MPLIYVTGEIGAGKSSLCAALADLGATVIVADDIVRWLYANDQLLVQRIAALAGDDVVDGSHAIVPAELAKRMFADAQLRTAIEAEVHPRVRKRLAEVVAQLPADAVVIYETPIIRKGADLDEVTAIVNVVAPAEVRLRRLLDRGMNESDARQRMQVQADDPDRCTDFDMVVDNGGDAAALTTRAADLLNDWKS